jgi:glutaredoxin
MLKMKNIKIILLILSIGFLQSCKIYSENQRACNIDEMENIQEISNIWFKDYIEKSYIGKDEKIVVKFGKSTCKYTKSTNEYDFENKISWNGGLWFDPTMVVQTTINLDYNAVNFEKTKSSISEKIIPSPKTAAAIGVGAVVVGGVTWFLLEPASATAFFNTSLNSVSALAPKVLAFVFSASAISSGKNIVEDIQDGDFNMENISEAIKVIANQKYIRSQLGEDTTKSMDDLISLIDDNGSDYDKDIINTKAKNIFLIIKQKIANNQQKTTDIDLMPLFILLKNSQDFVLLDRIKRLF